MRTQIPKFAPHFLSEKYKKASYYLEVNEQLFNTAKPVHATWIDNATLARWFYQSSKEFVNEFQEAERNYLSDGGVKTQPIPASKMASDLFGRLDAFGERILSQFPKDKLVQKAIRVAA